MTSYIAALLLWSALHLIWQAAVIATLYAWWQRGVQPSVRYRVAMMSVVVLAAALVANSVATHVALLGNAKLGGDGALAGQAVFDRPFESMTLLMWLWAIGIGTHAIRLAFGSWHLARLRRRAVVAPASLVERVEALACAMAIPVPQVLISDSRIGPFVMKGVLMLPNDYEMGEELDALVLHELAHLRRRDVEANAVLRVIQSVLWFHPAIWRLMRAAVNAREEACDLESVARSRSALVLARALVKLEERRQVLGATDGALATRVRRLISGEYGTHRSRAFLIAPLVVFVAGGVLSAWLAPRSDRLALVGATAKALPVQRMVIDAHDPAGKFTLTLLNGRVAAATIAGVPVERDAIRRHERTVMLADRVSMELDPRGAIRWMPRCGAARAGGCD
jgi:beta-lactamase regulating signal transducer with metallopeptidase domain